MRSPAGAVRVARLAALLVGLAPGVAARQQAVHAAAPVDTQCVQLFDTRQSLKGTVSSDVLAAASGWDRVPPDPSSHRFQGDAVLRSRRIAVVLRQGPPGAEVLSHSPKGWSRQAVLIPCGRERSERLVSVKQVVNDDETVAVEACFRAGDDKPLGLRCELRRERTFVKVEAQGETSRLRIEAASRFGVIPDLFADDIVLDATKVPAAIARVPTENMFAGLSSGGALTLCLWDGPPQDVAVTLAGSSQQRRFDGVEINGARSVYFALLDFPGACHVGIFDKLPDRTEPIAGYKLEKPVKRLDWTMPFPAQWKVDFMSAELGDAPRSREMSAPYPYPVTDGKCQGFRFIKPSYVWDWGGGKQTEMSGAPDKYPSWVDFEGRGFVRPVGASYGVLIYPFDRGRGTPLDALTVTDLVRQTLGVGPCQYILDADRRMAATPGIFTCGGADMLKKMEGHMTERRAEAEKHLADMLVFMKAYRRRIEQYMAFKRDLSQYLEDQANKQPERQDLVRKMKSLLDGIPSQVKEDYPKIVEELNAQYLATLGSDDEAARKKRAELHPRFTAAGGAQDAVLARCHQAAQLARRHAGLVLSTDPASAQIAVEIRKQASAVLQNPMYHETKDRHR